MKAIQSILTNTSLEERKHIRSYLIHKYHMKRCTRIALFDILCQNPNLEAKDVLSKCDKKFSRQNLYKIGSKLKNDILSYYFINDLEGRGGNESVERECWKNLYTLHLLSSKNATYFCESVVKETEIKAKEYDLNSILLQVADYKSKHGGIIQEECFSKAVNKLAEGTTKEILMNNTFAYYVHNSLASSCESDIEFREKLVEFLNNLTSVNTPLPLSHYLRFNQLFLKGEFEAAYELLQYLITLPSEIPSNFSKILYVDKVKVLLCLGFFKEAKELIEEKIRDKAIDVKIKFILLELLCSAELQSKEDCAFEEINRRLFYQDKLICDKVSSSDQVKLYLIFFYIIKGNYQKAIAELNSLINDIAIPGYFLKVLELTCIYLKGDYDLLEYKLDALRKAKYYDTPLLKRMKAIATCIRKSVWNPALNRKKLLLKIEENHPWRILSLEKADLAQVLYAQNG